MLALVASPPYAAAFAFAGPPARTLPSVKFAPLLRPRALVPVCNEKDDLAAQQDAEERAETVEYFKTCAARSRSNAVFSLLPDFPNLPSLPLAFRLGTFSGGSLALFLALTSGAGMEDVLAGNIVLVALCVYGAYLFFFDGGVTRTALENQAIVQLANEEADMMAEAPRAQLGVFDAAAAIADPKTAAASLEADGCARVNGALSPETASGLLDYINDELQRRRDEQAAREEDLSSATVFGDVLMKDNRWDMYLDLEPPVRKALQEVLAPLKPILSQSLGEDAELFELSALVSDPRSPRQPVHPDTPWREDQGAAAITAFVALQDVDAEMGPTSIIPQTHTEESHKRFNSRDDGGREKVALLRQKPNHVGVLNTGDANLIDSRLIHCGGANESPKRRVLFYLSFKARNARAPSGSLLYNLRRAGYTLGNVEEWVSGEAQAA